MRKWTEEERKRQSELIKSLQPWLKSTGPRTKAGKKKCSLNARKHGQFTKYRKAMNRYLNHCKKSNQLVRDIIPLL